MDLTGRAEHCNKVKHKGGHVYHCPLPPDHEGDCDFGDETVNASAASPSKSSHDMRGIDSELDPDD